MFGFALKVSAQSGLRQSRRAECEEAVTGADSISITHRKL